MSNYRIAKYQRIDAVTDPADRLPDMLASLRREVELASSPEELSEAREVLARFIAKNPTVEGTTP
jgi:hypothetical protein